MIHIKPTQEELNCPDFWDANFQPSTTHVTSDGTQYEVIGHACMKFMEFGDYWYETTDMSPFNEKLIKRPIRNDANPTEETDLKFDGDKARMDLLPFHSLDKVAEVLTFGAQKYEADSWRTVKNGKDRYMAALLRHISSHVQGEKNDPESGLSHLSHAACNALFLIELENQQ